jgi:ribonucleases P/MRP protein subunit RPP40
MNYKERLMYLQLPPLKYRRLRGDMIEVFKILTGRYDTEMVPLLKLSTNLHTRGNSLKLSAERSRYDLRNYSFPVRITSIWNALPDTVILCDSVNSFKNSFDRLWQKKELYYNYK